MGGAAKDLARKVGIVLHVRSIVLGKDTKCIAVSDEDAVKAMTEMQLPEFLIDLIYRPKPMYPGGIYRRTTTTVKDVTGNDAISFEQFVHDNRGAWI